MEANVWCYTCSYTIMYYDISQWETIDVIHHSWFQPIHVIYMTQQWDFVAGPTLPRHIHINSPSSELFNGLWISQNGQATAKQRPRNDQVMRPCVIPRADTCNRLTLFWSPLKRPHTAPCCTYEPWVVMTPSLHEACVNQASSQYIFHMMNIMLSYNVCDPCTWYKWSCDHVTCTPCDCALCNAMTFPCSRNNAIFVMNFDSTVIHIIISILIGYMHTCMIMHTSPNIMLHNDALYGAHYDV